MVRNSAPSWLESSRSRIVLDECELTDLCALHGNTDKGGDESVTGWKHCYSEFYGRLLASRRHEIRSMLEIGILRGGSLLAWRDFFPAAEVHGVDVADCRHMGQERLVVHHADAYSEDFMESLAGHKFDFILDDGPHTAESWVFFFNRYRALLSDGGIMMAEDVFPENIDEVYGGFTGDSKRLSVVDRTRCEGSSRNECLLVYM